jgi:hypothetical protein
MPSRGLVVASLVLALGLVPASSASRSGASQLDRLLSRHVPVLVLHPAEQIKPESVESFLAYADLQRRGSRGWAKVDEPLPAGGADLRLDHRLCHAIEGIAATSCYASGQGQFRAPPVVYGAAFRRGRLLDLQYWIWYPWNAYSPTLPPGDFWQVHEGDWEAVSVILDPRGRPLWAGYSQHEEGRRREWARVPKQGRRPVAYVALGSHANYFAPATHRFDPRVVDPLFISVIEQNGFRAVDRTGRGATIRPGLVRVSASAPGWMRFAGGWGEDQYIRTPTGEPVGTSAAGPRGPAFHEQWRRPVREVRSWPRG